MNDKLTHLVGADMASKLRLLSPELVTKLASFEGQSNGELQVSFQLFPIEMKQELVRTGFTRFEDVRFRKRDTEEHKQQLRSLGLDKRFVIVGDASDLIRAAWKAVESTRPSANVADVQQLLAFA